MFLALASLILLGTIVLQNYLVPPLRQDTISAGLTGPYHWYLDASYVVLSTALCLAPMGPIAHLLAIAAATSLMLTAITNTFRDFVDKITKGKHGILHTVFTGLTFASGLALECISNKGPSWGLTAANLAVPGAVFGLTFRHDYAEKLAVLVLCLWLITYGVFN